MSELADRIAGVRDRIDRAAARAGRRGDDVTLVGVSKTFPVESIRDAMGAGLVDFGENKAQEFERKAEALGDVEGLRWHFIGHLQRNKANLVVGRARMIHSLDSERLARRIDRLSEPTESMADCLIQLNVSDEDSKFGIMPSELPRLVETVLSLNWIRIKGLMTLASPTDDETVLRREFGLLRESGERLASLGAGEANVLSMGMSSDFEIAIEEGATHVRVGSAIFGSRSAVDLA